MLLIIFLCLTAKLTSVSGDCVVGTPVLKNFDFIKVGIIALTRSLRQATYRTAACALYGVTITEMDNSTLCCIKTVSVVDTQFT
jgi:hypothetical protein